MGMRLTVPDGRSERPPSNQARRYGANTNCGPCEFLVPRKPRPSAAVDLASVADVHDEDEQDGVLDLVEHAVIADAQPEDARLSPESLDAWRARVRGERVYPLADSLLVGALKSAERAVGRWREDDRVGRSLQSPRSAFTFSQGIGFSPVRSISSRDSRTARTSASSSRRSSASRSSSGTRAATSRPLD